MGFFFHCLEDKSLSQSKKEAISKLLHKMKLKSSDSNSDCKAINLMDLFCPEDQEEIPKLLKKAGFESGFIPSPIITE